MNYRAILNRRKGERDSIQRSLDKSRSKLKKLKKKTERLHHAQQIIQAVAKQTQEDLQYQISELVSLALSSTLKEEYNLHIDFVPKRGTTEADISLSRGQHSENRVHPRRAGGGGVCDIASFGLRLSVWSVGHKRTRPVFILDEPFKFINDPTRQLHKAAATMLHGVCHKLGIQIIIVTVMPEILEVADKAFKVRRKKRISKVKEVK